MNGLIILWKLPGFQRLGITWTLTSKMGRPPHFLLPPLANKRHTGSSQQPMRFLQFIYLYLFVCFLETIQMSELEPILYIYIYILVEILKIFPSCWHVTNDDIYFADAGICWRLGLYIYISIYIHIHIHIHTYIHAYIHTYTYIHTYIHTHRHTYIHTYTHTDIHTYVHTYTHTHIHTYTHTHIDTHRPT